MNLQNPYQPPTADEAIELAGGLRPGAVFHADPIQQAVDDWLTMEAKARAWDSLLVTARCAESPISGSGLVVVMERLLTAVSKPVSNLQGSTD